MEDNGLMWRVLIFEDDESWFYCIKDDSVEGEDVTLAYGAADSEWTAKRIVRAELDMLLS